MYRTILAAVDGSSYAESALDVGIETAKLNKAKLIIATVYKVPMYPAGPLKGSEDYPPKLTTPYEKLVTKERKAELESMLQKYADKAKKEGIMNAETKIIFALENIGAALVKEAESLGCALVVIASKGLTGMKRTLLGSIAGYISEYTHCDVLIVRR